MSLHLVFGDAELPAAAFDDRVQRAVSAMRGLGVGSGDVVALMLRNQPLLIELTLAVRALGAMWCPVNWHFRQEELAYLLNDCGARLLIAEPALLDEVAETLPAGLAVLAAGPGDTTRWPRWEALHEAAAPSTEPPAAPRGAMLYTSGTTGRPKGIRRNAATPEQAQRLLQRSIACYGFEPGMRALLSAPLYHSAPNAYAVVAAQVADATLVLEARFDAERTLQLIAEHRITHAYLVPTMYVRLLRLPAVVRQRHDLSSLRFVASTGSPCTPEVKAAMIDWFGPVLNECYGSSELGYMTHVGSADALRRPGTAGRALPGVEITILDPAGRRLPPNEAGLIYVRQPDVADFSYQGRDDARRAMESDGFLTMGDVGYLDDAGFLFIVDRASDMVISGGVNIYPAEIEQALLAMPGVEDCAVFGIPDAEFGEALAAAVQCRAGVELEADAVRSFLRERIAGYKVPARVDFHAALPREDTGKIFKRRLREPFWEGRQRRV